MNLRQSLRLPESGQTIVLILHAAEKERMEGKYVMGLIPEEGGKLAVVFDDSVTFHRDIVEKYGLKPLGGGWCTIDTSRQVLLLSGRSTQYGMEPDRNMTLAVFQAHFPNYYCDRTE
ncbi:hypothetical protein [Paludibaculum fermentans]|uniref:Uncharacterized protein n=1 Tax=Paludibaculum fermentans TaxID=1473598 RepID=A0A7S7NST7_PALFE|nr:hypothetical protein [Paludibaculum fermentans]QOY89100.1 hypothetical protein IRI77_03835 [Paludibaculum fermentans]